MARSFGVAKGILFNLLVKYGAPRRGTATAFGAEKPDDGREYGKQNHDTNYIVDVLANIGDQAAEGVAAEGRGANPEDAAKNVIEEIAGIGHSSGACYGRAKRPDDGNEAGENYSAASVLFIEIVSALEMAAAEKERIFAAIKCCSGGATDPVADLVTGDGAEHDRKQEPLEGNDSRVGEDARGDEQGVSGKKKANEKAGFDENDGANERSAARANQFFQSLGAIERVEKVEDGLEQAERFLETMD